MSLVALVKNAERMLPCYPQCTSHEGHTGSQLAADWQLEVITQALARLAGLGERCGAGIAGATAASAEGPTVALGNVIH